MMGCTLTSVWNICVGKDVSMALQYMQDGISYCYCGLKYEVMCNVCSASAVDKCVQVLRWTVQ